MCNRTPPPLLRKPVCKEGSSGERYCAGQNPNGSPVLRRARISNSRHGDPIALQAVLSRCPAPPCGPPRPQDAWPRADPQARWSSTALSIVAPERPQGRVTSAPGTLRRDAFELTWGCGAERTRWSVRPWPHKAISAPGVVNLARPRAAGRAPRALFRTRYAPIGSGMRMDPVRDGPTGVAAASSVLSRSLCTTLFSVSCSSSLSAASRLSVTPPGRVTAALIANTISASDAGICHTCETRKPELHVGAIAWSSASHGSPMGQRESSLRIPASIRHTEV